MGRLVAALLAVAWAGPLSAQTDTTSAWTDTASAHAERASAREGGQERGPGAAMAEAFAGSTAGTDRRPRGSPMDGIHFEAEARARIPGPLLDHYLGVASLPPDADETLLLLFERREQAAVLVESSLTWGAFTGFTRYERASKDELFPPTDLRHSQFWAVSKLGVGLVAEAALGGARAGVGASGSFHAVADELVDAYGASPRSWMVFARVGL